MSIWTTRRAALFSGVDQVDAFRGMATAQPCRVVRRAATPFRFADGAPIVLPETFCFNNERRDTTEFLAAVETTGLYIVHDDRLVFERYWLGNDATTQAISWSVVKSVISALIGVALRDRLIASVDERLTAYLPELVGTGYHGASIRHALQMSSGATWDETFNDPASDVPRLLACFAPSGSLDALACARRPAHPPGSFNHYNSMDTQVLSMLLRKVTGGGLTDYLAAQLWQPLGMENDGFWLVDGQGAEFASGGLCATLRDNAKFGSLFLHQGRWGDRQILPAEWVRASTAAVEPHLVPGPRPNSSCHWGYGYQWWVPDTSGCFMAVGAGNQFIYVSPESGLVIAKSTANRSFGQQADETAASEHQHLALFKAIEDQIRTDVRRSAVLARGRLSMSATPPTKANPI